MCLRFMSTNIFHPFIYALLYTLLFKVNHSTENYIRSTRGFNPHSFSICIVFYCVGEPYLTLHFYLCNNRDK